MNVNEIYQKAWKSYGTEAQMRVLMEECAELCDALITDVDYNSLISEIADVCIMVGQFKYILCDYLNDPNVFERTYANNIDEFGIESEDTSVEKTIQIILRVIYSINHYNRGKTSSEEICKTLCSAEHRLTCLYTNMFDNFDSNSLMDFCVEYNYKLDRLERRLE